MPKIIVDLGSFVENKTQWWSLFREIRCNFEGGGGSGSGSEGKETSDSENWLRRWTQGEECGPGRMLCLCVLDTMHGKEGRERKGGSRGLVLISILARRGRRQTEQRQRSSHGDDRC